ncbi:hypothetical protein O7626_24665 [Micromonospora sp. WMMD1102]|uniref:hypothetical protein n=1 Tax=Micromonospora sp. WMMD1102 TaxID=3016105 RepID=UPI0024153DAE|nr:hypothetical protein [Micromonospora sp. WMMD1102]MDG4789085.1 hypothetical protein [Micromonospora sp. WMMD1102]
MLLDIDSQVFDADDHQPVISLLSMVAKYRHDWRPMLPAAVKAERFVHKLRAAEVKLPALSLWAEKAVEEAAHRSRPAPDTKVKVTLGNLEPVVDDLEKPAVLVVENRIGDGGFIRAVAVALDDERMAHAINRRWLEFCNGGGSGQMPALGADECKKFAVLIRVAMLFDGDRDAPEQPSRNKGKARKAREAGVPHVHVFHWREVENYVPFAVWDYHFPEKSEVVGRLRGLIPRQRGYLDIKEEFRDGGRRWRMPSPLMPVEVALSEQDFAELGEDVVAELRRLLAMIHEIL